MLNFAERAVNTLLSVTMMLFSSYQGNNAAFSNILITQHQNSIRISTTLNNAFENDFEQIFRSGSSIVIRFDLTISSKNKLIATETFNNSITFDPMNRIFDVNAETANTHTFISSLEELIAIISEVDIFIDDLEVGTVYHFQLSAHTEKVYLDSLERDFDLMMLWNYKTPTVSFLYEVQSYES